MIFMEGVIFITDEIITNILNIKLKDLEDFSSYSKDGILYHDFTLKKIETSFILLLIRIHILICQILNTHNISRQQQSRSIRY